MKGKEMMLHQPSTSEYSTLSGFRFYPNHTKQKKMKIIPNTEQVFSKQRTTQTQLRIHKVTKQSALHTTQGFIVVFTFDSPFHFDFKKNKRNKAKKKENDDK